MVQCYWNMRLKLWSHANMVNVDAGPVMKPTRLNLPDDGKENETVDVISLIGWGVMAGLCVIAAFSTWSLSLPNGNIFYSRSPSISGETTASIGAIIPLSDQQSYSPFNDRSATSSAIIATMPEVDTVLANLKNDMIALRRKVEVLRDQNDKFKRRIDELEKSKQKANFMDDDGAPLFTGSIPPTSDYMTGDGDEIAVSSLSDALSQEEESPSVAGSINQISQAIFAITLGTFEKKSDALEKWFRLQSQHSNIVEDLNPRLFDYKMGDTQLMQLNAGPFLNIQTAISVCARLITEKQDCKTGQFRGMPMRLQ